MFVPTLLPVMLSEQSCEALGRQFNTRIGVLLYFLLLRLCSLLAPFSLQLGLIGDSLLASSRSTGKHSSSTSSEGGSSEGSSSSSSDES